MKAEIQDVEIRAHAAQGPALVELKVDTEADEGQVQRLSVRAPFRREVQRLIMAPLFGDNRASSERCTLRGAAARPDGTRQLHAHLKWADDAAVDRLTSLPLVLEGVLHQDLGRNIIVDERAPGVLWLSFNKTEGNTGEILAAPTATFGVASATITTVEQGAVQEVQVVSVTGATGGTFRLVHDNTATEAIPFDASPRTWRSRSGSCLP